MVENDLSRILELVNSKEKTTLYTHISYFMLSKYYKYMKMYGHRSCKSGGYVRTIHG